MVNVKELKAQLQQEAQGTRRGLPFKKLAVNHSSQEFVLKEGELEKVLGKQVELFIVGEFGQYFYFDPKLEKLTVLSQIKKPALIKQAIDLKSGKKMAEILETMKSQNIKPTFSDILVVLVKVDDTWQEVMFYVKGALLQSWFEIVKEIASSDNTPIGNIVKIGLKAQKKGSVRYATLSLVEFIECEDEDLVSKGVSFLNKFKEAVKSYNQYEPPMEEEVSSINEEDKITSIDDLVEF
ncbi:MAG: hypothetical protein JHC31_14405 [Sulfurihydrogenibium sp.]|jgi:hypothetical protein|nr:hypothetical protein [Sulfurihydrogenibium sp.]